MMRVGAAAARMAGAAPAAATRLQARGRPTPTPGQVLLLPGALLQSIVELAAQAGRAPDAYSHAEHGGGGAAGLWRRPGGHRLHGRVKLPATTQGSELRTYLLSYLLTYLLRFAEEESSCVLHC